MGKLKQLKEAVKGKFPSSIWCDQFITALSKDDKFKALTEEQQSGYRFFIKQEFAKKEMIGFREAIKIGKKVNLNKWLAKQK